MNLRQISSCLAARAADGARMMSLEPFGESLWLADGPVVDFDGFADPTRMVVVRLADGGLRVWSPIALTEGLRRDVAALGPVRP